MDATASKPTQYPTPIDSSAQVFKPTKTWWLVVASFLILIGLASLIFLNVKYNLFSKPAAVKEPPISGNCPSEGFFSDLTEAEKTPAKVCYLSLTGFSFTQIPPEIFTFTNLKELYLKSGQLQSVPKEISLLSVLVVLNLSGNQLTSLPDEIGQLTQLRRLVLSDNKLVSLPPSLTSLQGLAVLFLNRNELERLPSALQEMQKLRYINLEGNNLSSVEKARINKLLPQAQVIF